MEHPHSRVGMMSGDCLKSCAWEAALLDFFCKRYRSMVSLAFGKSIMLSRRFFNKVLAYNDVPPEPIRPTRRST